MFERNKIISFLIIAITILLYVQSNCYAINGNPFITNFVPDNTVEKRITCIEHNNTGIMFLGTPSGILIYNSVNWEMIKTPSGVKALYYQKQSDILYVGMQNRIGKLKKNALGIYLFSEISINSENSSSFFNITENKTEIIFQSQNSIISIDKSLENVNSEWHAPKDDRIDYFFHLDNNNYIILANSGLNTLNDNILTPINSKNSFQQNDKIVFASTLNNEKAILASENGIIYTLSNNELEVFKYDDEEYARASRINGGLVLAKKETVVLSTLAGGIILIDLNTGKTKNIINYKSGIPDDEIYSIGLDNTGGIWASHLYGVSRIDLNFPVESFHNYNGLKGNIFSIYRSDTTFLVGTNEGLFSLTTKKNYQVEKISKLIKVPVKKKKIQKENIPEVKSDIPEEVIGEETIKNQTEEEQSDIAQTENEQSNTHSKEEVKANNKKESRFSKFFSFLSKEEKQKVSEPENEPLESNPFHNSFNEDIDIKSEKKTETTYTTYTTRRVNEQVYKLQSITYQFQKVEGLNDKVKGIVKLDEYYLLSTNTGLYYYYDNNIQSLLDNQYIEEIQPSKDKSKCFVLTRNGVYKIEITDNNPQSFILYEKHNFKGKGIVEDDNNNIWVGSMDEILKINIQDPQKTTHISSPGLLNGTITPLLIKNDTLEIFNEGSMYSWFKNKLFPYDLEKDKTTPIIFQCFKSEGNIFLTNGQEWEYKGNDALIDTSDIVKYLTLFTKISSIFVDDIHNIWIIDNYQRLYKIKSTEIANYTSKIDLTINYLSTNTGFLLAPDKVKLEQNQSNVEINVSAPFFLKNNAIQYSYLIDNISGEWSEWYNEPTIRLPYFPAGKFEISIKARNIFGVESQIKSFTIKVAPPFWKTIWFYLLMFVVVLTGLFFTMKFREANLLKTQKTLEDKVTERTQEIERQKNKIENQSFKITDSIMYAKRIQEALLPSKKILKTGLKDSFIFYQPRDIVSGDFYWTYSEGNDFFIAAADCTGHGVPGALMSVLGISFLNDLVKKQGLKDPAEILNNARDMVIESLNQRGDNDQTKDGMDMAFCHIDFDKKVINYAGAYNPLVGIKDISDDTVPLHYVKGNRTARSEDNNKIVFQIEADRMPVSSNFRKKGNFSTKSFEFKSGDRYYIYSDGFLDQFGGENGKRYFSNRFREKILEICEKPMKEQKDLFEKELKDWQGNISQTDDILIIGFKL